MRLYRIEITGWPALDCVGGETVLDDPILRSFWEDEWGDKPFFMPSERKLYRSRSSAREKQQIVERWGGTAVILEAEVGEFVPVEVANMRRRVAVMEERVRSAYRKYEDAHKPLLELNAQIREELDAWRGRDDEHAW